MIQQQRVAYLNAQAQSAGIKANSSLSTALALNPTLKTFERDLACERQQLLNLAHWAYRFSPTVCLTNHTGKDNLLLIEINGSIKLFGNLQNLLALIAEGLGEHGYSFLMGLAHTPKAAGLLAFGSRLLSRPLPVTQAPSQSSCLSALRQLPLEVLHTETRYIGKLKKMGLSHLGQILDLPSSALGKRFGRDFLHYLQQITGEREDPQRSIKPRDYFSSQLFFMEPIENSQMLLFPMQRLLDEFCRYLHVRQLHCNHFTWHMHQGRSQAQSSGKFCQLDIKLSQPQTSKANFLSLTRIQLEKLRLNQAVHTVELRATHFVKASAQTPQLFDQLSKQASKEPLDNLLDKLQARLGPQTVHSIDCEQEHLPERASKALTPDVRPSSAALSQHAIRPAWLLRRPARIQQRVQQGENAMFWRGKLELLQGPERIENNWWETPQQRDYYIAQHEDGSLYWVYKDIPSRTWYVQGVFA